jgi:hypothetical protein
MTCKIRLMQIEIEKQCRESAIEVLQSPLKQITRRIVLCLVFQTEPHDVHGSHSRTCSKRALHGGNALVATRGRTEFDWAEYRSVSKG